MHQYMLRAEQLENSFTENGLGTLEGTRLALNQQCVLARKNVNGVLG